VAKASHDIEGQDSHGAASRSATPSVGEQTGGTAAGPEAAVWTGRTSWRHYAGRVCLWFLGNAAAAVIIAMLAQRSQTMTGMHAFGLVAALAGISAIIALLPVALVILGSRYRLTTERLIIERGILSQTIDQTELIRVDDVRIHKSLLDRILGLGTVAIISTDVTDREILVPGVVGAEEVAEAVRARVRALRKKSLFVENL